MSWYSSSISSVITSCRACVVSVITSRACVVSVITSCRACVVSVITSCRACVVVLTWPAGLGHPLAPPRHRRSQWSISHSMNTYSWHIHRNVSTRNHTARQQGAIATASRCNIHLQINKGTLSSTVNGPTPERGHTSVYICTLLLILANVSGWSLLCHIMDVSGIWTSSTW